jgi:opacity protein-like surface antigen
VMYDVTERWDAGVFTSMLTGAGARQYGVGLETGYAVIDNLWVSAGYNVLGFTDDDLVDSDYTRRGFYIRLRYKFDEKLFTGRDHAWNNSLPR